VTCWYWRRREEINSNLAPEDNSDGILEAENRRDRFFQGKKRKYLAMLARAISMLAALGWEVATVD
jgi:hypothetical protein